jgi:hypothetical protein
MEVSTCTVVSGRSGAVLESGNLFKGGAAILADPQNGDIIVLSLWFHEIWRGWGGCTFYSASILSMIFATGKWK